MLDEATRSTLETEVLPFLNKTARGDVKAVALEYFLGMTGSPEGRNFISKCDKYMEAIVSLTTDDDDRIVKEAYFSLINLTAEEDTSWKVLNLKSCQKIGIQWLRAGLDPENKRADVILSLISNITRSLKCAMKVVEEISQSDDITMEKIVYILCNLKHNKYVNLHHLGTILSNLTQVPYIRQEITNRDRCIIQRLLPFTGFSTSLVRRGGVIGALRNCCFDSGYHEWLLGKDVDMLPRLVLPLAGPEEFDEDDMERLPDDLQYLPPDKTREPDSDIRLMLIETINQLLATRFGRETMKKQNIYVIMRELHQWETDRVNDLAIQNVIDILIGDEPDDKMENLHNVEIPEDVSLKFHEEDKQVEKDLADDEEKSRKIE